MSCPHPPRPLPLPWAWSLSNVQNYVLDNHKLKFLFQYPNLLLWPGYQGWPHHPRTVHPATSSPPLPPLYHYQQHHQQHHHQQHQQQQHQRQPAAAPVFATGSIIMEEAKKDLGKKSSSLLSLSLSLSLLSPFSHGHNDSSALFNSSDYWRLINYNFFFSLFLSFPHSFTFCSSFFLSLYLYLSLIVYWLYLFSSLLISSYLPQGCAV